MDPKNVLVTLLMATVAMLMHSSVMVSGQPDFIETFNVTKQAGSYNTFITNIRQRVANPNNFSGGVPMLPPEESARNRYFYIVLAAGTSSITIRIRTSDLYLVGFQATNQWYEYTPIDNNPRQIDNAVLLNFTGGYVNDESLPRTLVGRAPLAEAITSLAVYNRNNRDNSQQMLIRLILMFPEALRFRAVADHVYGPMHDTITQQATIGPNITELIHDWGALSMALRRSDLFASFNEFRNLGISNAAQLASLLGLVLYSSKTPTRPSFSTQAISTQAASDVTSKGRQLVEIFWVQILNIDNENPGDLYGKIQIVDDLESPQYIFNRSNTNYISIRPNEFAPLTGPTRAISAYDSFYIDVSLMDHDTTSSDDEVSKGQIVWNYFADNIYDQPVSQVVKGMFGSIAVSYAVYSDAVTATMQVMLINGDNENPANVYGTLKATNIVSNGLIILFNKKSNEYVDIKPQQLIPLLRSVVVVPLTSSIQVIADLWDQDTSSADDPIAQGNVTFAAAASGSNVGRISGKFGVVEVNVTWSSSWA
ncbi:hypothetical protein LUZ63_004417 [Rhynchospora breviuscula]|uniref:DUF6598 domain-containing protein n=1 Tax=Rhynchospora breviuscula TaxID=2022672 RepID=A0A9Q0I1P5_9POAL|nr:hypothetical protein LUZ63_004417 [Rhynchospora breviuscula]